MRTLRESTVPRAARRTISARRRGWAAPAEALEEGRAGCGLDARKGAREAQRARREPSGGVALLEQERGSGEAQHGHDFVHGALGRRALERRERLHDVALVRHPPIPDAPCDRPARAPGGRRPGLHTLGRRSCRSARTSATPTTTSSGVPWAARAWRSTSSARSSPASAASSNARSRRHAASKTGGSDGCVFDPPADPQTGRRAWSARRWTRSARHRASPTRLAARVARRDDPAPAASRRGSSSRRVSAALGRARACTRGASPRGRAYARRPCAPAPRPSRPARCVARCPRRRAHPRHRSREGAPGERRRARRCEARSTRSGGCSPTATRARAPPRASAGTREAARARAAAQVRARDRCARRSTREARRRQQETDEQAAGERALPRAPERGRDQASPSAWTAPSSSGMSFSNRCALR